MTSNNFTHELFHSFNTFAGLGSWSREDYGTITTIRIDNEESTYLWEFVRDNIVNDDGVIELRELVRLLSHGATTSDLI